MVIKTSRHITALVILVTTLVTFYILYFSTDSSGLLECFFVAFFWLTSLPFVIADCKTVIIDKDGITVKFLFIKKKHSWNYYKTKRIQTFAKSLSGEPSVRGAFFSKKQDKRAFFLPSNFDALFPLSFRYVYFNSKSNLRSASYFEVEEKLFRKKMDEWGIEFIEDPK